MAQTMDVPMDLTAMPKPLNELSEADIERKARSGSVTTRVLHFFAREFTREGFEWMLPVIFSKSTDPLWPDPGASIEKRIEVELYENEGWLYVIDRRIREYVWRTN